MTEIYDVWVVTYLYALCMYVPPHTHTHKTHTHAHTYTLTLTYLSPLQLNHDSMSQWVRNGVVIMLLVAGTTCALFYTRRESMMPGRPRGGMLLHLHSLMQRFIDVFITTSAQHGKDSGRLFLSKPEGQKKVCATRAQAGKYITQK